jgi:hypothetical protein
VRERRSRFAARRFERKIQLLGDFENYLRIIIGVRGRIL